MKVKMNKYLPIGTIVLLKNAKKKIMITGFCIKSELNGEVTYYDYIGCLYPEGILNSSYHFKFNYSDILKIVSYGYVEDKESLFKLMASNFCDFATRSD